MTTYEEESVDITQPNSVSTWKKVMLHGIGILIAIYTTPGHSIVITDRAAVGVAQEINIPHAGGVEIEGNKVCFTRQYPPACYGPITLIRR